MNLVLSKVNGQLLFRFQAVFVEPDGTAAVYGSAPLFVYGFATNEKRQKEPMLTVI